MLRNRSWGRKSLGFTLIELLLVIIVLGLIVFGVSRGCHSSTSLARPYNSVAPVQANVGIRYQPPIIPIAISIGTDGVTVSIDGHVQTPIGMFSVYGNVVAPFSNEASRTLTVVAGDRGYVYPLDERTFEVNLPNDLNGKTKLSHDGKGNIRVEIPNPVLHEYLERHGSGTPPPPIAPNTDEVHYNSASSIASPPVSDPPVAPQNVAPAVDTPVPAPQTQSESTAPHATSPSDGFYTGSVVACTSESSVPGSRRQICIRVGNNIFSLPSSDLRVLYRGWYRDKIAGLEPGDVIRAQIRNGEFANVELLRNVREP